MSLHYDSCQLDGIGVRRRPNDVAVNLFPNDCPSLVSSQDSLLRSKSSFDSHNISPRKDTPSLLTTKENTEESIVHAVTPCSSGFVDEHERFDDYHIDVIESKDNQEPIYKYPSGRLPLIPLADDGLRNRRIRPAVEKKKKQKDISPDSVSWLEKTFCVVPSNSTIDSVKEYDHEGIVMSRPFDEPVHFISDEGSVAGDDDEDKQLHTSPVINRSYTSYSPGQCECLDNITYRLHTSPTIYPQESGFSGFLQNGLICDSWKYWNFDDETIKRPRPQMSFDDYQKNPHNSSINPDSKKKRIQNLRFNMDPFNMDGLKSSEVTPTIPVQEKLHKKTKSFSNTAKKTKPKKKLPQQRSFNDCEWHSNVIANCGSIALTQEIEVVPSEGDFVDDRDDQSYLGYDSDPSELMFTCERPNDKNQRERPPTSIDESEIDDSQCLQIVSF